MLRRVRVVSFESKIMAVKLVRELSGFGLKESLDHVEASAAFEVSLDDYRLRQFADQARREGVVFEFDPPIGGFTSSAFVEPEGGEWVVRYSSGPNKIAAIKLARELTYLGLAEAKNIVEQCGVIRSNLSRAQADAIVAQFREIGSSVEVFAGTSLPKPQVSTPSPSRGSGSGYVLPDDDF